MDRRRQGEAPSRAQHEGTSFLFGSRCDRDYGLCVKCGRRKAALLVAALVLESYRQRVFARLDGAVCGYVGLNADLARVYGQLFTAEGGFCRFGIDDFVHLETLCRPN